MNNIITIMRRDLGAYFTSPIGYIFMMVFVTLSVGLYISTFFVNPIADMRPYFDNLPLFFCVFIPAVTMRIWAEERKENTWEMLLTFPMKAWELVVGKFLAGLVFFMLTLATTVTVPMMLIQLGNPDWGVMLSGYFGTVLLGAFMLSLGILFSGFFKDQIVAFAVTLLTCFAFFLLGTTFFAAYLDDVVMPGLGSNLSNLMGFFSHFESFTRGVIDFADVVYFLAWTAIFLVLNVLYIDGRNRPNAKAIFAGAFAMSIAIGLLFNYLMADFSLVRIDTTEDKIYTVSPASKNILANVDTPVQVNVYVTPSAEMPTQMKNIQREITDKLEELRLVSGGKINYKTIHMAVSNVIADEPTEGEETEENIEDSIEKRMLDKGVEPFSVQAYSGDEITNKLIYSSIGVGYKDRAEEIIPQILPQTMPELEYRLISTIYKLTREDQPKVALVAPKEAVAIDPMVRQMMQQQGMQIPESDDPYVYLEEILRYEKYDVERVELTKESPLPAEYDTLVVVNPRALNERQKWEINRAIHSGKSVVLAVQNYTWDYRSTAQGLNISRREEQPQVNDLLESYGLGISDDVLMDVNKVTLTIRGGGGNNPLAALMGQPVDLPMHILVANSTMDPTTAITSRLSNIFYLWGTALELEKEKLNELGLDSQVVMTTTDQAWTAESGATMTSSAFEPPAQGQAYPLMAVVQGQFPDAFADKERPAWPKPEQQPGMPPMPEEDETPEEPAAPVTAAPGKLVLMGCSQMFRKDFMQQGNLDLFLNSVDAVTLDENLVQVRGKKPVDRTITKPSEGTKTFWRFVNYGLANIIIAGLGIGLTMARRQSRNAYTMAHANKRGKGGAAPAGA